MVNGTVRKHRKAHKLPVSAELELLDWGPRGSVRSVMNSDSLLVDRGIPGEQVIADVFQNRRPWRAVVSEVLTSSPHRTSPPCPYVLTDCGGCQWQHMNPQFQLATKQELVDREMAAFGVEARVTAL